jgi:hypothetical protein
MRYVFSSPSAAHSQNACSAELWPLVSVIRRAIGKPRRDTRRAPPVVLEIGGVIRSGARSRATTLRS